MKITVRIEDDDEGVGFLVEEIDCDSLLEGLKKLHEKLNDVANPRAANMKATPYGFITTDHSISC